MNRCETCSRFGTRYRVVFWMFCGYRLASFFGVCGKPFGWYFESVVEKNGHCGFKVFVMGNRWNLFSERFVERSSNGGIWHFLANSAKTPERFPERTSKDKFAESNVHHFWKNLPTRGGKYVWSKNLGIFDNCRLDLFFGWVSKDVRMIHRMWMWRLGQAVVRKRLKVLPFQFRAVVREVSL